MSGWRMYMPASPWEVIDRCGSHAGLVYLAIAEHAQSTGRAWPSVARLAAMTGISARSVQRARAALEDAGYLSTYARHEGKRETSRMCVIEGWQTLEYTPRQPVTLPPSESHPPPRQCDGEGGDSVTHRTTQKETTQKGTEEKSALFTAYCEYRGLAYRPTEEHEEDIKKMETVRVSEGMTAQQLLDLALGNHWVAKQPRHRHSPAVLLRGLDEELSKRPAQPPDTTPKDAARLHGILAATQDRHPDAPDDFILNAVHAEAHTILKRHKLTTLAAIKSWLEKSNAA